MDGTLVDSTDGVVGAWETFQESYPDIDINKILKCQWALAIYQAANLFCTPASHGIRTVDNLREHCRIQDPDILEVG